MKLYIVTRHLLFQERSTLPAKQIVFWSCAFPVLTTEIKTVPGSVTDNRTSAIDASHSTQKRLEGFHLPCLPLPRSTSHTMCIWLAVH